MKKSFLSNNTTDISYSKLMEIRKKALDKNTNAFLLCLRKGIREYIDGQNPKSFNNKAAYEKLSRMIGRGPDYIKAFMHGDVNPRLSDISELCLAIGKTPTLTLKDIGNGLAVDINTLPKKSTDD